MIHQPSVNDGKLSLSLGVAILCLNRSLALQRCVQSIEQSLGPVQIVVVDNGSSPALPCIHSSHVKWVRSESNLNCAGGRNLALQHCETDIVLFIDDDAEWRTGNEKSLLEPFQKWPELAVLSLEVIDAQTRLPQKSAIPRRDKQLPTAMESEVSYFCGCAFAVRKRVFNEARGFWGSLEIYGEELDLSYRLLARGHSILFSRYNSVSHSTSQARRSAREVYYQARNRPWVALRNLPLRHFTSTLVLWWLHLFLESVGTHRMWYFFKGAVECVAGLPRVFAGRCPISETDLARVRALGGRVSF